MKILAIGDFHGKFPEKLIGKIKSENPDLILCVGDFPSSEKIRKVIFKHWTNKAWYDVVGLKEAKKLEKESFVSGLKILKKLNSLRIKTFIVWGNSDFYKEISTSKPKSIIPGNYDKKLKTMKNITLIHNRKRQVGDLEFVGHGGYVDITEYIKNPIDKDKKKQEKRLKRYKKTEKKLYNMLEKLNLGKNFVFLTHYTPYKIFDKVKFRKSPMFGKNAGWEPYNKVIKKYKPKLVICGHMHEYQGKRKLGNFLIINPGPAFEGKAAVIELDEKTKKIQKIKFVR